MEGLGSAAGTALPLVFGFALLRRARIDSEQAVTRLSETRALMRIGFFVLPSKLCLGKRAFSSMANEGSAHRAEPASNHCGLALAASEAGRTARADADTNFVELAQCVGFTGRHVHAFKCRPLKVR